MKNQFKFANKHHKLSIKITWITWKQAIRSEIKNGDIVESLEKQANEMKIKYAIIVGEHERNNNVYTIKNLLEGNQKEVNFKELLKVLSSWKICQKNLKLF